MHVHIGNAKHQKQSFGRCSAEKVFWEIPQNSQENTYAKVSFLINFIKKEALAQVFSCELREISKNTFLYGTPPIVASETYSQYVGFILK